jgi:hypothetical protein
MVAMSLAITLALRGSVQAAPWMHSRSLRHPGRRAVARADAEIGRAVPVLCGDSSGG